MEIRKLKTDDLFVLVGILAKISGKVKDELSSVIVMAGNKDKPDLKVVGKTKEQTDIETGMQVISTVLFACIQYASVDIKKWFASLCNMTVEEYEASELDTTIDLIEQLKEKEDIKSFFSKAFALFKKTQKPRA